MKPEWRDPALLPRLPATMNSVLLRLDWNGAVITRRAADDYVNLSALVRAHNLATGQKRKIQAWYRNDDAQEFLDALAADTGRRPGIATPGALIGEATFLACGKPALIEVRHGSDTWGHPDVAVEIAGWLSKPLRIAINRWFRQEVERQQKERQQQDQLARQGILPCALPMAEAIVARRDRNVEVSRAAAAQGVPFHELHNARNVGLTGHRASHWREVSGVKNWIEKADWEHQQLHSVASQAGLNAIRQLNPDVSDASDYVDAMRSAAADLREFARKYNMPWQPRFMPHRIGTPRAERVLAASGTQLPLLEGV